MIRPLTPLFALVVVLGVIGCQGQSPDAPAANKTETPSAPAKADPKKEREEAVAKAADEVGEARKALESLPSELRHDAYEYYGLANPEPLSLAVSGTNGVSQEGAQSIRLVSQSGEEAVFTVQRSGGLSQLGSQTVALRKDGIYVTASDVAKIGAPQLEMPAKLSPGTKWTTTAEVGRDTTALKVTSTQTVVGIQKLPESDQDALLITGSGKGTLNGEAVQLDTKVWWVKGKGQVRAEIKTTRKNGGSETVTLRETQ